MQYRLRLFHWLFGAYLRTGFCHGKPLAMAFFTRQGARNYGQGWSSIDPYAKFLTGPTVFVPGQLFRRDSREVTPS